MCCLPVGMVDSRGQRCQLHSVRRCVSGRLPIRHRGRRISARSFDFSRDCDRFQQRWIFQPVAGTALADGCCCGVSLNRAGPSIPTTFQCKWPRVPRCCSRCDQPAYRNPWRHVACRRHQLCVAHLCRNHRTAQRRVAAGRQAIARTSEFMALSLLRLCGAERCAVHERYYFREQSRLWYSRFSGPGKDGSDYRPRNSKLHCHGAIFAMKDRKTSVLHGNTQAHTAESICFFLLSCASRRSRLREESGITCMPAKCSQGFPLRGCGTEGSITVISTRSEAKGSLCVEGQPVLPLNGMP